MGEAVLAALQGMFAHGLCRLPGGSSFHPLEASPQLWSLIVAQRAGGGSANRTRTPTPEATGWILGGQQAPGGSSGAWALLCGQGGWGGGDPPCRFGKGPPFSRLPPGTRCTGDHSSGELWGAVGPVSGLGGELTNPGLAAFPAPLGCSARGIRSGFGIRTRCWGAPGGAARGQDNKGTRGQRKCPAAARESRRVGLRSVSPKAHVQSGEGSDAWVGGTPRRAPFFSATPIRANRGRGAARSGQPSYSGYPLPQEAADSWSRFPTPPRRPGFCVLQPILLRPRGRWEPGKGGQPGGIEREHGGSRASCSNWLRLQPQLLTILCPPCPAPVRFSRAPVGGGCPGEDKVCDWGP